MFFLSFLFRFLFVISPCVIGKFSLLSGHSLYTGLVDLSLFILFMIRVRPYGLSSYEKGTTCNVFADVLYMHARAHDYINFIELE